MDLLMALAFSLLMVPLVMATGGALRVALGLPFILFLPGYALVAALFPRKEGPDGVQRLAMGLGLSIVVVPLLGLVLNWTWGVRLYPILTSVLVFIAIMAATAWWRRRQVAAEQRFEVRAGDVWSLVARLWRSQGRPERALSLALALAAIGALGMAAYAVTSPRTGERFTEFYVVGPDGTADSYPEWLLPGQKVDLVLGVVNRERESVTYAVETSISSENVDSVGPIALDDGQGWEKTVSVSASKVGDKQKIQFALYKEGDEEPYETLCLWVDVRTAG